MTDPKEINEEVNEELSTDELKSVSGGINITIRNNPSVTPQDNRNRPDLSCNDQTSFTDVCKADKG